jgi:hypothetical protein
MSVYQTYIDAMNDKIRKQSAVSNPFKFKHIASLKVNTKRKKNERNKQIS